MLALRPDQICSRILRLRARKSQRATEALERVAEVRCAVIAACVYIVRKSTAPAISDAKATTRNRAKSRARSQAREQFLMDVVEPAVTENRDHVFWPKQRNDSVHNRIGIFLIEGGPTGLRD
jgi:hypothetical protein